MRVTRVFETTINIHDPINYCVNKQKYIEVYLAKHFEKKCYQGTYIESIQKVVQYSPCYIVNTNLTGHGYIYVRFIAVVLTLLQNEVLPRVQIKVHSKIIVGVSESPPACVSLIGQPRNRIYKS